MDFLEGAVSGFRNRDANLTEAVVDMSTSDPDYCSTGNVSGLHPPYGPPKMNSAEATACPGRLLQVFGVSFLPRPCRRKNCTSRWAMGEAGRMKGLQPNSRHCFYYRSARHLNDQIKAVHTPQITAFQAVFRSVAPKLEQRQ